MSKGQTKDLLKLEDFGWWGHQPIEKKKKDMKIERIVQALYYILVLIFILGMIGVNDGFLISPNVSNKLIWFGLVLIAGLLIYYYFPKKTKKKIIKP